MLTYIVSLLLSISEQHFIFVTIGQGVDTYLLLMGSKVVSSLGLYQ